MSVCVGVRACVRACVRVHVYTCPCVEAKEMAGYSETGNALLN